MTTHSQLSSKADIVRQRAEQHAAAAFIAARRIEFEQFGVTNMTAKQRDRIRRLDVISPERKLVAFGICNRETPPNASTGRMRVVDMNTGEIRIQRAPRRSVEIAWAA